MGRGDQAGEETQQSSRQRCGVGFKAEVRAARVVSLPSVSFCLGDK